MPMPTREAQRQYQREWIAARRAAFFADKICVDCGSKEQLELDHRDPAQKEHHAIWSWSQKRRDVETAKCDVRCATCHRERHAKERRRHNIGGYERGCRCESCKAAKAAATARETRHQKSDPKQVLYAT